MSEIEQRYPNAQLGDVTTPRTIGSALSAARTDNLVTITVNWSTAAGAWAITNAIGEVSSSHIGQYLDYAVATDSTPSSPTVSAHIVSAASNAVTVSTSSNSSKLALLAALILIALIVGIALAFLLDYLDDRIRSKEDIRDLFQLPIYGEVPHAPTPGHSARAGGKSAL
jgi:capsular polysaccharide biosynthesis protein